VAPGINTSHVRHDTPLPFRNGSARHYLFGVEAVCYVREFARRGRVLSPPPFEYSVSVRNQRICVPKHTALDHTVDQGR
jgi:hypothetical protein